MGQNILIVQINGSASPSPGCMAGASCPSCSSTKFCHWVQIALGLKRHCAALGDTVWTAASTRCCQTRIVSLWIVLRSCKIIGSRNDASTLVMFLISSRVQSMDRAASSRRLSPSLLLRCKRLWVLNGKSSLWWSVRTDLCIDEILSRAYPQSVPFVQQRRTRLLQVACCWSSLSQVTSNELRDAFLPVNNGPNRHDCRLLNSHHLVVSARHCRRFSFDQLKPFLLTDSNIWI